MAVRHAPRSRFVLVLLVLTAGTIITLSYRGQADQYTSRLRGYAIDVFSPVQSGVLGAARPVADFFRGAVEYGSVRRQNAELRQRLGREQRIAAAASDQARQLGAVAKLENLPFAPTLPHIAAEVSDRSFSNFQLTVDLDRGSVSGVRKGMTVVSGEGLVGRVVQVARSRSTVLLLTDPTSSVGVRDGTAVGVASGGGQSSTLRVAYINPGTPVHKDDVMVTSGLQGSVYPPGIPVGQVKRVAQRIGDLQETVDLAPMADMAQLQFVDILAWSPATAGPPGSSP